ncbi:MAG TPA: hypothetical protein VIH82_12785 [Acidimicrobiia bacterium]
MKAWFTKTVAVVAICAAMIVGTIAMASASVDAKGTKKQFCSAALKVGTGISPSGSPTGIAKKAAAKLEKAFHKLEAKAPTTSLKNAVATMSDFYGRIADGDSASDLAEDAADYAKAALKFSAYLTTKCISTKIPDITLPDITLP